MDLFQAIHPNRQARIALVGSGGKTTALFYLAPRFSSPVIVTTTTHFGQDQLGSADRHFTILTDADLAAFQRQMAAGVNVLTGPPVEEGRISGLDQALLERVLSFADANDIPILIEADGSRRLPLKATAEHEPAIPSFVNTVIVVAGLSGLGKPLGKEWVHRPERFTALTGLQAGEQITPEVLVTYLLHSDGGLKNIPAGARKIVLLNQADTPDLREQAEAMHMRLLEAYEQVIVAALKEGEGKVFSSWQPVAGIILAAGESQRYQASRPGQLKQLLDWEGEPFVHKAARTALEAGLSPVVVVTGAQSTAVQASVQDLPVQIAENPDWQLGQSASLKAGLLRLPKRSAAAVFLLADQPQIRVDLVKSLVERYARTMSALVAPRVGERRGNPVLFSRSTFPDLLALEGDQGGRSLFTSGKFTISWLDWEDDSILMDVDTWEDFHQLARRKDLE